MICDNVVQILNSYQIYAKKIYGQNFLRDKNTLEKIIRVSNVTKKDIIIEIGPGIGCLTEFLALNAKKVIAYEIDSDMINILNDTLKTYSNVEIRHIDFLKADLSEYTDIDNVKVVANLPYYITTAIITKLLGETNISQFTFMVQKEVGQRMTGKPKTKDYNALSVLMKYKTDSSIVGEVSRNSFCPAPKVESVLLLVKRKKSDYEPKNEANFIKFAQTIFSQRRKTIVNNINKVYGIEKEQIEHELSNQGLKKELRAEELNDYQIYCIYRSLFESH